MKTNPFIIALDLGTSACKGLLLDTSGRIVATRREEIPLITENGRVEQEPEVLWQAVQNVMGELIADLPKKAEMAAVGLSAQMTTHMLAGADGEALTRFVTWADGRAERESRELATEFSAAQLRDELGADLPVTPAWPLPKLKWWRRNEPALLDRADYLVQPKDWILWKLCGAWLSDLSSLRGLAHQETGAVSGLLAKWAGFEARQVLPVAAPDAVAGTIWPPVAQELGLATAVPVVVGWNDLAAAVLGSTGLPERTVGFDITGTTEHLGVCLPAGTNFGKRHGMSEIPLETGHRLRYGVTSSSGRIARWYWEEFRGKPSTPQSYAEFEQEAARVAPGADGLLFHPCLEGERAPWFNPRARGGFYGVSVAHGPAHFSRAVLEGIAFTLRSIHQRLGAGAPIEEFYAAGGGSTMAAWNQIKADILQVPLVTPACAEAGCLGAAILAARSLGWPLGEAARAFVRKEKTFQPNPALADLYRRQHERFERLYHAVEPILFPREKD